MMTDEVLDVLSAQQARVLGSLLEKQMTTPDYYPLTLKALTAACNQKSSRVPVMNLSESEVAGVISGLRSQGLVTARMDGRADRFEQHLSRALHLTSKQRAIICALMLRSTLTLNEIRINTTRMVEFDSNEDLQQTLDDLIQRDPPLIMRIPRAAGQREDRFAHLLSGEPELSIKSPSAPPSPTNNDTQERITYLENEVAELKSEVARLYALTGHSKT